MKVSYYKTNTDKLLKAFCNLAEKCYYSGGKTNVIVSNQELAKALDQSLWTYSKKHFIPHALAVDPFPEKQPILISTQLDKSANYSIIILVNLNKEEILNLLSLKDKIVSMGVNRLILLEDEMNKIGQFIEAIIEKSAISEEKLECFSQNINGNWEKL